VNSRHFNADFLNSRYVYEGNWERDMYHGYGKLRRKKDGSEMVGIWENNTLVEPAA